MDREFGQHRNWWVRDSRIFGNPLSILMFLLSHAEGHLGTQAEMQNAVGLGQSAWRAAKQKLMQAGFLIEVQDRHPRGLKYGQKRYTLILRDPEEGVNVNLEDAIIKSEKALQIEEMLAFSDIDSNSTVSYKPQVRAGLDFREQVSGAGLDNQEQVSKPLVRAGRDNREQAKAGLDNQEPLIGREERKEERIYINTPSFHSIPDTREQIAEIDEQLESLAPGLNLTYAKIDSEVGGRVDLSKIDLSRVVREVIVDNKSPIARPTSYVATSIVRSPLRWLKSGSEEVPYAPGYAIPEEPKVDEFGCDMGVHDWGPLAWGETGRRYCVLCNTARRSVDAEFAALENQFDSAGGA